MGRSSAPRSASGKAPVIVPGLVILTGGQRGAIPLRLKSKIENEN